MQIETKLGTIVAQEYHGRDYPGINLAICRDDKQIGMCLLEVDQSEPGRPILKVHVWSPDNRIEEPVFSLCEENMDRMFEEA